MKARIVIDYTDTFNIDSILTDKSSKSTVINAVEKAVKTLATSVLNTLSEDAVAESDRAQYSPKLCVASVEVYDAGGNEE